MKSVLCSGTKLNLVCVPWRKPLPVRPPEPMAILDWLTLYPAPMRSWEIPRRFSILSLWCGLSTLWKMKSTEKISTSDASSVSRYGHQPLIFRRISITAATAAAVRMIISSQYSGPRGLIPESSSVLRRAGMNAAAVMAAAYIRKQRTGRLAENALRMPVRPVATSIDTKGENLRVSRNSSTA